MAISISSLFHSRSITTYSCHAEISEDTSSLCAHDTAVPDLCRSGVTVHLAELELRLRAGALRKRGIADNVAKGLPVEMRLSVSGYHMRLRLRPGGAEHEKNAYLSGSCCSKTLRLV